jgi:hypothetical protein
MTAEDLAEMNRLCKAIQEEQDSRKFDQLVEELNDLLDRQEKHLAKKGEKSQCRTSPGVSVSEN